MTFKSIPVLIGITNSSVDTQSTGSTLIFTNPNENGIYGPFKLRVYGSNISGVVTPPTISIGTNASSYDNILTATQTTGLVNGEFIDYAIDFPCAPVIYNDSVFVNVSVAATATNYECKFTLFMDYIG